MKTPKKFGKAKNKLHIFYWFFNSMKTPIQYQVLLVMFLLFWNSFSIFSQQFFDEIKTKLPKPDQYKLLKAETFNEKGQAFLFKDGQLSDPTKIPDSAFFNGDEKKIEAYYLSRIQASYCFKNANSILYNVLDKHIKTFWGNFKNNKLPLREIIIIETAAYDSLIEADKLRSKAETEMYIENKIPLVARAEKIESNALFKLEKVLYIYMNWPEKPNLAWLSSIDKGKPINPDLNKNISLTNNILYRDTIKQDSIHKATNIYSLMHISENQIDIFNEFLKAKYPEKAENYLIDFQGLYESVIDSLHNEWHKYLYSGKIATDTIKSNINSNVQSDAKNKLTQNETNSKVTNTDSINNNHIEKKKY